LTETLSEGIGAINYQGKIIEIAVNRLLIFVIHDKPADTVFIFWRIVNTGKNDHY
jgi:hypothetical protein